jgi:hypothetical protein
MLELLAVLFFKNKYSKIVQLNINVNFLPYSYNQCHNQGTEIFPLSGTFFRKTEKAEKFFEIFIYSMKIFFF